MKVSFFGDFSDVPYEGFMNTVHRFELFLEENGFEVLYNSTNADIIHAHSNGLATLSYNIYKIKKKYGLPCIYSLYSTATAKAFEYIKNSLEETRLYGMFYNDRLVLKQLIRGASTIIPMKLRARYLKELDAVVVASGITAEELQGSNVHLIRIGIDTEKFRPKTINRDAQKVSIAYIGHPSAFKGMIDFIKATSSISDDFDVRLYSSIITKGLKRIVASINPRINLFGHMPNMLDVYNDVDIVILPYRSHHGTISNPLVLLEAMACGKAVITTNLRNIKEIVQDTCMVVPPCSPGDITDAVYRLSDREIINDLGVRARKQVVKEHDQKKTFNQYLRLYEVVCDGLKR